MNNFKRIPEKLYKEIVRNVPIVCLDIIVRSGKSFLLVKRKNQPEKGRWWFPGGRLHKKELAAQATQRILKEETGLVSKKPKFLGVHEYFAKKGHFTGIREHEIVIMELVDVKNKKIVLDSQSSEYRWFTKINPTWDPHVRKFIQKTQALRHRS